MLHTSLGLLALDVAISVDVLRHDLDPLPEVDERVLRDDFVRTRVSLRIDLLLDMVPIVIDLHFYFVLVLEQLLEEGFVFGLLGEEDLGEFRAFVDAGDSAVQVDPFLAFDQQFYVVFEVELEGFEVDLAVVVVTQELALGLAAVEQLLAPVSDVEFEPQVLRQRRRGAMPARECRDIAVPISVFIILWELSDQLYITLTLLEVPLLQILLASFPDDAWLLSLRLVHQAAAYLQTACYRVNQKGVEKIQGDANCEVNGVPGQDVFSLGW